MTISHATLYHRAEVYATSIGPRADPTGEWFGIYLTMHELRLYAATQKIKPLTKTVANFVETWGFVDWVRYTGDIFSLKVEDMDRATVWFRIPPATHTRVMIEAERAGFPENRVVTDLTQLTRRVPA